MEKTYCESEMFPNCIKGEKFNNKTYGDIVVYERKKELILTYYSLSTRLYITKDKIFCFPLEKIFSMRNKLGKNGVLIFDYSIDTNGIIQELELNNEPEVQNIVFNRVQGEE